MPDPNKKISATETPCQAKLLKTGSAEAKPAKKDKDKDKEKDKDSKECKSTPKEAPAVLNKEACDTGPACHAARPDLDNVTKERVDKSKPGCIDYECEDPPPKVVPKCVTSKKVERTDRVDKSKPGCIDYECDDPPPKLIPGCGKKTG